MLSSLICSADGAWVGYGEGGGGLIAVFLGRAGVAGPICISPILCYI